MQSCRVQSGVKNESKGLQETGLPAGGSTYLFRASLWGPVELRKWGLTVKRSLHDQSAA